MVLGWIKSVFTFPTLTATGVIQTRNVRANSNFTISLPALLSIPSTGLSIGGPNTQVYFAGTCTLGPGAPFRFYPGYVCGG
jgi:hypothetical protein